MRVVILNQHPEPDFCVFICFVTGSECMDAPFFLKGQYIEKVSRENLFFPWRSTMSTFDPLYECKSRKYSLFWTEGNNGGKSRTPGERWPKCLKWTQWCSSKPLGPQHGLLSGKSFFKTQNFQKWHLFCHFLLKRIPLKKYLKRRVIFEKRISGQQAMLKTQELRGASLGSFQTFWSPFPWRSNYSFKTPLTSKWRIFPRFTLLQGVICARGGTPGEK